MNKTNQTEELIIKIDGEPFKPASAETLTRLSEPEPEMFSFEWTKKMLGLDIHERNHDAEAWEREQARQPDHD
jgi:hypothetical protein